MSVKIGYALMLFVTSAVIAQPWYGSYEKQSIDDYVNNIAKYARFVSCVRATQAQSHSLTQAQQKCVRNV